jgi:hypothetical protein
LDDRQERTVAVLLLDDEGRILGAAIPSLTREATAAEALRDERLVCGR